MTEPVWLEPEAVLIFHGDVLGEHGGLSGLRDQSLFDSALARPRNAFAYGEADLCLLAALYAAGIVKNHPFVDGNKRTGFLCAAIFLELNGNALVASEDGVVANTVALAVGDIDEHAYAAWLRENTQPD
jgi:death-on-curing protein